MKSGESQIRIYFSTVEGPLPPRVVNILRAEEAKDTAAARDDGNHIEPMEPERRERELFGD